MSLLVRSGRLDKGFVEGTMIGMDSGDKVEPF